MDISLLTSIIFFSLWLTYILHYRSYNKTKTFSHCLKLWFKYFTRTLHSTLFTFKPIDFRWESKSVIFVSFELYLIISENRGECIATLVTSKTRKNFSVHIFMLIIHHFTLNDFEIIMGIITFEPFDLSYNFPDWLLNTKKFLINWVNRSFEHLKCILTRIWISGFHFTVV